VPDPSGHACVTQPAPKGPATVVTVRGVRRENVPVNSARRVGESRRGDEEEWPGGAQSPARCRDGLPAGGQRSFADVRRSETTRAGGCCESQPPAAGVSPSGGYLNGKGCRSIGTGAIPQFHGNPVGPSRRPRVDTEREGGRSEVMPIHCEATRRAPLTGKIAA